MASEINNNRLKSWSQYYEGLRSLHEEGFIELPYIPQNCKHNAYVLY